MSSLDSGPYEGEEPEECEHGLPWPRCSRCNPDWEPTDSELARYHGSGPSLSDPVDEHEVRVIEAALGVAADHGESLGNAARAYVEREHALPDAADAYVRALELAAGGAAVDDAVLWRIAEAAGEVGVDDASALVRAARDAGIIA